jgi:hypothetical protein
LPPTDEPLHRAARRALKVVRTADEAALRRAVRKLLSDGYDMGEISGLVLDAMGVGELLELPPPLARRSRKKKEKGT